MQVQVIPWALSDSNSIRCPSPRLDPTRTVFVGGLHGLINAGEGEQAESECSPPRWPVAGPAAYRAHWRCDFVHVMRDGYAINSSTQHTCLEPRLINPLYAVPTHWSPPHSLSLTLLWSSPIPLPPLPPLQMPLLAS